MIVNLNKIDEVKLETLKSKDLSQLSRAIAKSCSDFDSLVFKSGSQEELEQAIATKLFELKSGAIELRPGHSLVKAVCALVRADIKRQWVTNFVKEDATEDEDRISVTDAIIDDRDDRNALLTAEYASFSDKTLDDIDFLTAEDKMLIAASSSFDSGRLNTTESIAEVFDVSTRQIRSMKEALGQKLKKFGVDENIFEIFSEKYELHYKKEKLGNAEIQARELAKPFIPATTSFTMRTCGIR